MTTNDKEETNKSSNSLHNLYKSCGLSSKSKANPTKIFTMTEEICYYLSTVTENQTLNQYWNSNKSRLLLLSSIVRRYNVICASSMPSESAFSVSGFIQRKHRSSLAPETLRYLMILRK
ncbi:unnamed protein product [Rotaria magnacalcarata]|uniref:HAT C-terminal dimerisation domain-containing protein n=3 Tax=Rotaria magnacalcarata TaxID=392030 RepID=A0A816YY79_9BILA|nr:unnamed protein product [Rotaria magnacalcarata]CAF2174247.1 unnamed protein product [Rotaria magnacalcarata]CAF2242071.1 unnamed protein product [Rotaria magnacalcarata]CAF4182036.1 unnamed protein product [Rotaria magnacalcarata]CAF4306956.1 unnamed protein product [Rotaria magnacalcarata]